MELVATNVPRGTLLYCFYIPVVMVAHVTGLSEVNFQLLTSTSLEASSLLSTVWINKRNKPV